MANLKEPGLARLWEQIVARLGAKVDKVEGKGLSANDFTDEEKAKLAGIEEGATSYEHPTYTSKTSGLYKVTVDSTGHVSAATAVTKSDITGLGIPAQDTVITVDSTLSSTSTNPVQNKVVNTALAGKADSDHTHSYNDLTDKPTIPSAVTVDTSITSTGTNPVQGKAIYTALSGKADSDHTHSEYADADHTHSEYAASDHTHSDYAASSHTHAAGDVTSGTFAAARIPNLAASKITSGTLGTARGGTGITSNPSMLTNLGSTTAASVFATSPRPGVTGTLPVANGGTGNTSVDTTPTSGSTKMVTSGGVYTALAGKAASSHNQDASTITAGTLGGKVQANATAAATLGDAQVRDIIISPTDLTAGTSALATGTVYLVYE